ncbi:MAG: VOC family protein [Bacteroidota bacterium]
MMPTSSVHGVGGVLSADIAVPEHGREQAFYAAILTTGDAPLWRDDLTNNLGTPIIGLGERTPELAALPLQWMPHIQVADVAASVAHAVALGGTELMHGKTEEGQSQWAVLVDSEGAAFGVVPTVPGDSDAAARQGRQGCIAGLTLAVSDVQASRDFYRHVVGWRANAVETENSSPPGARLEMQASNGATIAHIQPRHAEDGSASAAWLLHLPVDDLAESLRRVVVHGGEVIREPAGVSVALVGDPVGVVLALQAG